MTIPTDVQQRVNALVVTGRYLSEEEVLRAAMAALEERNEDLAAITSGIDDMEHGRCRPLDEFDADFRQQNQIGNDG